ncbi:MAG: hypothetical protein LEGION0398_MBIBDBAK_00135 [Legionellaceae bacterium]
MKTISIHLFALFLFFFNFFSLSAYAAPTACPDIPVFDNKDWVPEGHPSGELAMVAYYEGTQNIYCYYRNPSQYMLGFLRSKFMVTGITGNDWKRISPCPMNKPCYICEKNSQTSCHFQSKPI